MGNSHFFTNISCKDLRERYKHKNQGRGKYSDPSMYLSPAVAMCHE